MLVRELKFSRSFVIGTVFRRSSFRVGLLRFLWRHEMQRLPGSGMAESKIDLERYYINNLRKSRQVIERGRQRTRYRLGGHGGGASVAVPSWCHYGMKAAEFCKCLEAGVHHFEFAIHIIIAGWFFETCPGSCIARLELFQLPKHHHGQTRDLEGSVEEMKEYADVWMEILQEQIECDRDFTGDPGMKLNGTVYNGTAGLAMLDMFLARKYEMCEADRELLVLRAGTNLEISIKKLKGRKWSFLGGDAGPLALTICMYYDMAERGCPTQDMVCHYKEKLLSFLPVVLEPCGTDAFGLLCGNVGYLWALLFVAKHCPGVIDAEIIQQVVISIVDNGRPPRAVRRDYLLWKWRGQEVLGAPHGMFGILYVLLKAVDYWPIDDEDLVGTEGVSKGESEANTEGLTVEEKHGMMVGMFCMLEQKDLCDKRPRYNLVNWILNTLNFLTRQIFASGNTLPALGYSEDKYVNWAFGAPGAIYTFIEAHRVFRSPVFLSAAYKAAETIWHRGIVKAGYGLADGVAGNAYALMAMFRYTKEEKYRDQAFSFAEYCYHYGLNDDPCAPPPTHPLSLYEGLTGVIYMLYDFAKGNPKFPGYEL